MNTTETLELRSADPFAAFRFEGEGPQGADVLVWGRTFRHAAQFLAGYERDRDPRPWSQDDFDDRVEGLVFRAVV